MCTCELCKWRVCMRCFERAEEADHACDPATLETLENIRRACKPCPWCSAPIHRISGCRQMWCTACNKPWDWNTGQQLRDVRYFHNPHMLNAPRPQPAARAGAGADECASDLDVMNFMSREVSPRVAEALRHMNEVLDNARRGGTYMPHTPHTLKKAHRVRQRMLFQAGLITEAAFKDELFRADRLLSTYARATEILCTAAHRLWAIARQFMAAGAGASIGALNTDMLAVRCATNAELRDNASAHGTNPVQLDDTWRPSSSRKRARADENGGGGPSNAIVITILSDQSESDESSTGDDDVSE